jgi:hypothetical protein
MRFTREGETRFDFTRSTFLRKPNSEELRLLRMYGDATGAYARAVEDLQKLRGTVPGTSTEPYLRRARQRGSYAIALG